MQRQTTSESTPSHGCEFSRKVLAMLLARRLRKQLRVVQNARAAGVPVQGWGPTMESLRIGRREFYGIALSDSWLHTRTLIYVYSDEKFHEPSSFELRLVDAEGTEVDDISTEFSSGDSWHMDEFTDLINCLAPGEILWLDPVESFRLVY